VRAATDVPNAGSIAVLRRLGFEEWKRTEDGPAGTLRFRLGAERWRADRR
jgi:RimJ/RimL family protein N-acetyltransferase